MLVDWFHNKIELPAYKSYWFILLDRSLVESSILFSGIAKMLNYLFDNSLFCPSSRNWKLSFYMITAILVL